MEAPGFWKCSSSGSTGGHVRKTHIVQLMTQLWRVKREKVLQRTDVHHLAESRNLCISGDTALLAPGCIIMSQRRQGNRGGSEKRTASCFLPEKLVFVVSDPFVQEIFHLILLNSKFVTNGIIKYLEDESCLLTLLFFDLLPGKACKSLLPTNWG